MYYKYLRILAALALVLAFAEPTLTLAAQTEFSTNQFVRVSSDAHNVGFVRGSITEISNAERGTYLEAISIVAPTSGNSASGSVTIREVTWDKDWTNRCSDERFNSKDCTFSFNDSQNRAQLKVPAKERTYVVKTGQTISIPARNVMTPSANKNKGEDGYYILTLQNVNYAQNPMAEFRGTAQKSQGSNPAPSSSSQTTISSASSASSASATANALSFSLPARTTGMSASDYYNSVQVSYQSALNQMQSLAQQYAAQVQGISQQSSTQTQDVTSSNTQFTSSQDNLSALSNQLLALQLRLLNGSASGSTGSVTQAPASPTAAPAPTIAQGCGNAGYENVGGEWKYVGCSGYYGQGAGNQQRDVAAGYRGADPANAVQGSLGHYDENGVYYADAKFDHARDADSDVDVRAGQLGVDYCSLSNGSKTICSVSYYDPEGIKLTQTPFNPAAMLTVMDRFGIDREQLEDLEKGMDKKNIPHLPYQMFPGTGSDAGINLTDLANGGLGTAYDWRVDPLCQSKGPTACQQVKANAQLAENLEIEPTPGVTKTNVTPLEAQLNDIKRQAVEIQTKI